MRLWCVLFAAGCGFRHGELPADASKQVDVRTIDAPDIDAPPGVTCYAKWLDDSIRFHTPAAIAAVNTAGYERDPFVTADERALYYGTAADIWFATRASIGEAFGTPSEASEFNSTEIESKLSISTNGLVAVVGSSRPGGLGGIDVWESIRTSTTQQWPAMNRTNVMMISTAGSDHDPTISGDAQRIYIAPDNPGAQHIVVAQRTGNGTFAATTPVTALDSGTGDADPSPTPDERIIAFASNRSGAGDLYYATRSTANGTFGTPRAIPDVNTAGPEGDPHVSADGCRIYFARLIDAADNWDIFVAEAMP